MKNALLASLALFSIALPGLVRGEEADRGPVELRAVGVGREPDQYKGTPRGRLMAERAAHLAAMRNLVQVLEGSLELGDPEQSTRVVEGFLAGHTVVRKTELADGSVEVEVAIPISRAAANYRELWRRQAEIEAAARRLEEENARLQAELTRVSELLKELSERLHEVLRLLPH